MALKYELRPTGAATSRKLETTLAVEGSGLINEENIKLWVTKKKGKNGRN